MTTEDFINSITRNVANTIEAYKDNNNIWKQYARIATYQVKVLCIQGIIDDNLITDAWDELMLATGFNKLYAYPVISEHIIRL